MMSVTVCELPDSPQLFADAWVELLRHQRDNPADLVVLNEVPFDQWFGAEPEFDRRRWDQAVAEHEQGISMLDELDATVIGTAPVDIDGQRFNRAFTSAPGRGLEWWRRKAWIPDEDPVYEATWYSAAGDRPDTRSIGAATVGVLTCTELWAMDWAGQLGRMGAQVIATPRATGADSVDKWLAAGRVAAVVSGAFSISSNRTGNGFGGHGWIISPDGDLLAATSPDVPFATHSLDLQHADNAKSTYPRYALWQERWSSDIS